MLRTAATIALQRLAASSAPPSIAIRGFSAAPAISRRPALLPILQPLPSSFGFGRGYARKSTASEDELASCDFPEDEEHSDDYSASEVDEGDFSDLPDETDSGEYKSEKSE